MLTLACGPSLTPLEGHILELLAVGGPLALLAGLLLLALAPRGRDDVRTAGFVLLGLSALLLGAGVVLFRNATRDMHTSRISPAIANQIR